jgi:hypothetical protein
MLLNRGRDQIPPQLSRQITIHPQLAYVETNFIACTTIWLIFQVSDCSAQGRQVRPPVPWTDGDSVHDVGLGD